MNIFDSLWAGGVILLIWGVIIKDTDIVGIGLVLLICGLVATAMKRTY